MSSQWPVLKLGSDSCSLYYAVNTLGVVAGITHLEGMHDSMSLRICVLHIVFVSLLQLARHNCRNYEFLVITKIILLSVNSLCLQGHRTYGLIFQAFYSSEYN